MAALGVPCSWSDGNTFVTMIHGENCQSPLLLPVPPSNRRLPRPRRRGVPLGPPSRAVGVMATSWGDAASEVSDMDRSQSSASYDSRERVPLASSPKLVGRDSAAFDRATALSGTAGRLRSAAMGMTRSAERPHAGTAGHSTRGPTLSSEVPEPPGRARGLAHMRQRCPDTKRSPRLTCRGVSLARASACVQTRHRRRQPQQPQTCGTRRWMT